MKAYLLALLFALTPGLALASDLDEIVFITEEYPPFNFERDGRLQGIAVEVLEEALQLAGSKQTRADFRNWPWARGYETTLQEPGHAIFSMSRTEARENLFQWVGPISPSRIALVGKKARNFELSSAADINASELRIAVIREDIGEQLLLELGVAPERIVQVVSNDSAARMLEMDRVDLWAYGDNVVLWVMKEQGFASEAYESVLTLRETGNYIGLHRDTDPAVVSALQQAIDQLHANGHIERVIANYQ